MTDDRPFVVGFIASPHPHTPFHLRTLEQLPEVEDVHLCGIAGENLASLEHESTKVRSKTQSIDKLLARDDLDVVLVCVRTDLCSDVLEAAASAEKPVLFEKPGALQADDLRHVANLARYKRLTMGVALQWRGSPMIQEIRRSRQEGALGRVMAVESRIVTSQVRYRDPSHWLFRKDTAGSGILSWLGCHHIDMLCYLLDDHIVEVTAMVDNQNPEKLDVEDTAGLVLRFSRGVLGTVHAGYHLIGSTAGYAGAAYDTFIGLRGTDGYVRIPMSDGDTYTIVSLAEGWASAGKQTRSFDPPQSPAYGGVAGEEFVRQFLYASRAGEPALCPIESMVHILEVIEAAIESSETGRVVKLG